jgi:type II secretory pathway component PulC
MKKIVKYIVLLFTIIFAIVFLVAVVYPYMLKESGGIQSKSNNNVKRPSVISDDPIKTYDTPNTHSKSFIYPANSFEDPFSKASASVVVKSSQQPTVPSTYKSSVALTGVIWGKGSPVAIIKDLNSNRTYVAKVGQELGTAKILEIRQRSVVIRNNDKTSELQVWSSEPGI